MKAHRKPDETRRAILDAAFAEMHQHGFQATSVNDILARAGLTKGGFYHHFPTKNALGFAVVEEVIRDLIHSTWLAAMEGRDDPLAALAEQMRRVAAGLPDSPLLTYGCPLNNLAQEMSALDDDFRTRLNAVFDYWIGGIASALRAGQARGTVRAEVDADATAAFIVAALEGCMSLAKNARDAGMFASCTAHLEGYLEGLRAG